MTTYNSYEAAKIDNPDCDIYKLVCVGNFVTSDWIDTRNHGRFTHVPCKPADYCMTVEKFLADGYKFVDGDLIIGTTGNFVFVGVDYTVYTANIKSTGDGKRYILRAAVLEERVKMDNSIKYLARKQFDEALKMTPISQKPRTKVEYVKSDIESRGRALDAFDGEVELFELVDGEYKQVTNESDAISKWRNLYERIETPMTWKEELYNYLDNSCEMSDDFDDSFTIEIEGRPLEFNLNDDEFVDMCKLVASLNSVN